MPVHRGIAKFYYHYIICFLLHLLDLRICVASIQQHNVISATQPGEADPYPYPLDDLSNETSENAPDAMSQNIEDYADTVRIANDDFNAPPPWIQHSKSAPQNQQNSNSYNHKPIKAVYRPHHHKDDAKHTTHTYAPTAGRQCAIQITTSVPGNCMKMPHTGSACVAGEYMEIYSADCL